MTIRETCHVHYEPGIIITMYRMNTTYYTYLRIVYLVNYYFYFPVP